MSKERARRRAERETTAAVQRQASQRKQERTSDRRARDRRRQNTLRSLRLWSGSRPGAAHRREQWAITVATVVIVGVIAWLVFGSLWALFLVVLLAVLVVPVLLVLSGDRRRS